MYIGLKSYIAQSIIILFTQQLKLFEVHIHILYVRTVKSLDQQFGLTLIPISNRFNYINCFDVSEVIDKKKIPNTA